MDFFVSRFNRSSKISVCRFPRAHPSSSFNCTTLSLRQRVKTTISITQISWQLWSNQWQKKNIKHWLYLHQSKAVKPLNIPPIAHIDPLVHHRLWPRTVCRERGYNGGRLAWDAAMDRSRTWVKTWAGSAFQRYSPILADRWVCGRMIQYFAKYMPTYDENTQSLLAFAQRLLSINPRARPLLNQLQALLGQRSEDLQPIRTNPRRNVLRWICVFNFQIFFHVWYISV